jgi:Ca-activated chloride channel homolog
MRPVYILLLLMWPFAIAAQSKKANEEIIAGNTAYKEQQYAKAEEFYLKALTADPQSVIAKYNLATALYKQDRKVEAAQAYQQVAEAATDENLKAKSFYNKGVILSQQKNLEESIEAYKNALRNNPADKEARENLQKAMLELKKKTPPKKQEDKQKKKQEQQPQQQQPKMKPKEAEQRLKLLQQKEKEVQQRVQREKTKSGGSQEKDW